MQETRVEKYKKYRCSLVKEGAINDIDPQVEEKLNSRSHSTLNTTSTLPIDQVIKACEELNDLDVAFFKRKRRNRIVQIIVFSSLGALLVAGLIILGIIAWGK